MRGKYYKGFYTGGNEYQVREAEDATYGVIYLIYRVDEVEDSELIYTVYRESAVDVFIQNIMDAYYEYDMNI